MSGMNSIDLAIREALKAKAALDNAIRAITPPEPITAAPKPAKVTCPREVFILWEFNKHNPRKILGIYSTKIEAEQDMRLLRQGDERDLAENPYLPAWEYDIQSLPLHNNRVD